MSGTFIAPIEPMSGGSRVAFLEPMSGGSSNSTLLEPMGNGLRPDGLVAQALNISRASLTRAGDMAAPAPVPSAASLPRWEPWVRASMAAQQLFSGLRFDHGALWLLPTFNASGAADGPAKALLSMSGQPDQTTLKSQLQLVLDRMDDRPDRLPEVLTQANGQWPFWSAVTNINPASAPRTFELIEVALSLSPGVGQRFKHEISCPRPADLSAQVQPIIPTPRHASLPSGHATAAYLFLGVVDELLGLQSSGQKWVQLNRLSWRIAENRVVAGLHYPMDSIGGWQLGTMLAKYFVAKCKGGNLGVGASFNTTGLNGASLPDDDTPLGQVPGCSGPTSITVVVSVPILSELWTAADEELKMLGLK